MIFPVFLVPLAPYSKRAAEGKKIRRIRYKYYRDASQGPVQRCQTTFSRELYSELLHYPILRIHTQASLQTPHRNVVTIIQHVISIF